MEQKHRTSPEVTRAEARTIRLLVLLPCVIVLLVSLVILQTPVIGNMVGDVCEYAHDAYCLAHGLMPYRDFSLEYPPLAMFAFFMPEALTFGRLTSFDVYLKLWCVGNAALCAGGAILLARLPLPFAGKKVVLGRYAALVLVLSPLIPWRYDLFPALLTLLALHAVLGRRPGLAGLWLGFGIAAKLYPIVLVPVVLAYYWVNEDRPASKRLLLGCVGAVAASLLPFAAAGSTMLSAWQYHQRRGLELESLPAGVLMLAHRLAAVKFSYVFNYGAFHVLSPSVPTILHILPLVFGSVFLLVIAAAVRRFRADRRQYGGVTQESLVLAMAAMLLAFIVCNKVLSPQYLIWLLPFVPLLRPQSAMAFAALCAVTIVLFPFAGPALLQLAWPAVLALNLRNLGAVLLLAMWVRECAVSASSERRAVPIIKAKAA